MAMDEESSRETSIVQTRVAKPKWYRSTFYNALILGVCNFLAPGIWGAMNSVGAGGEEKPYLVNTANALTFCLMVIPCFFSSVLVRYIGIKWALIFGTIGYAPYAAGLYTNNRYGNEWLVLLGAALCGISAGVFWMAETAIALSYPEPYNQGKFLGFWLSFRLGGQILGGAINLGLNAKNSEAGKVSYVVYLIFIALQASGPFAGLLSNQPSKVQRTDGLKVHLSIIESPWYEIKATATLFFSKKFLLIVPLIGQAVNTEAVMFTFESLWFSVRARALGSFLSGVLALIGGNLLGFFLDYTRLRLVVRARGAFITLMVLQEVWWTWATVLVTEFRQTQPTYDWSSSGFGRAFAVFILGYRLSSKLSIPLCHCSYFVVGEIARSESEVIRIAALLRGTESAWQAISYGLNALPIFAQVGGVYLNFNLWFIALWPAWLVVRQVGVSLGDRKVDRDQVNNRIAAGILDAAVVEKEAVVHSKKISASPG